MDSFDTAYIVFERLDTHSTAQLHLVCKFWYNIMYNHNDILLWKQKVLEEFGNWTRADTTQSNWQSLYNMLHNYIATYTMYRGVKKVPLLPFRNTFAYRELDKVVKAGALYTFRSGKLCLGAHCADYAWPAYDLPKNFHKDDVMLFAPSIDTLFRKAAVGPGAIMVWFISKGCFARFVIDKTLVEHLIKLDGGYILQVRKAQLSLISGNLFAVSAC